MLMYATNISCRICDVHTQVLGHVNDDDIVDHFTKK